MKKTIKSRDDDLEKVKKVKSELAYIIFENENDPIPEGVKGYHVSIDPDKYWPPAKEGDHDQITKDQNGK